MLLCAWTLYVILILCTTLLYLYICTYVVRDYRLVTTIFAIGIGILTFLFCYVQSMNWSF